jgi:hypothetical protein
MGVIKWGGPTSPANLLTTELNSLADDTGVVSANVSNDDAAELYLYADFALNLATQGGAREAGAVCELYLVPTLDGSNYSYGATNLKPAGALLVANFQLDAATTARLVIARQIPLPPFDFKIVIFNVTGQAFAASGNILSYSRYNMQAS